MDVNLPEQAEKPIELSLVLPVCHAEVSRTPAKLAQVLDQARVVLAKMTASYEILVVEYGTCDVTSGVAVEQPQLPPQIKLLRVPADASYGEALQVGLSAACGSLIALVDGDGQYELGELQRMLPLMQDFDLVCGYRIDRPESKTRRFLSAVYNQLARWLLHTQVRDAQCGFKLLRREALAGLTLSAMGPFVQTELLSQASLHEQSVVEVGVTYHPPKTNKNPTTWLLAMTMAMALVRYWWQGLFAGSTQSSTTQLGNSWSKRAELAGVLILALAASGLFFGRLSYPLMEPDETRYAQIAYEMHLSGDWITPTLEGEPYLDKPPLLYWATVASYRMFGVNEFAARFPVVLSAWLTVLLTYVFGRQFVGSRAAWFGGMALLLCGGFVLSGRFIMMD